MECREILDIRVFPSKDETAKAAARFIADEVKHNPRAAITYATGDTMLPVYSELGRLVEAKEVDFSRTAAFHLDEYYPCHPDASHSFVKYLITHVFNPFHIEHTNRHTLNGLAMDPHAEAQRYDNLLGLQPIALAILGIGPGSHIGFNEQGTPFDSRTHLAALSGDTIKRDREERGQSTPERALTQGIGNTLSADKILLVAYGEQKGKYLCDALCGEINTKYPASALRPVGDKVHIFIDCAAAKCLE